MFTIIPLVEKVNSGFLLSVQPQHADDNGEKTQYLANNGAQRKAANVIDQPGGRTDQTVSTNGFGIRQTEAEGGGGHTDDRQKFNNQIYGGGFLAHQSKGHDIGCGIGNDESNQPAGVVGVVFLTV